MNQSEFVAYVEGCMAEFSDVVVTSDVVTAISTMIVGADLEPRILAAATTYMGNAGASAHVNSKFDDLLQARKVQTLALDSNNELIVNLANGHIVQHTLSQDVSDVTISNWPDSMASQIRFVFTQDSVGSHTINWPDSSENWYPEGDATAPQPVPGANKVSEIYATSLDEGTTVRLSGGTSWNG